MKTYVECLELCRDNIKCYSTNFDASTGLCYLIPDNSTRMPMKSSSTKNRIATEVDREKFDNDENVLTDLNGKGCDLKFLYVLNLIDVAEANIPSTSKFMKVSKARPPIATKCTEMKLPLQKCADKCLEMQTCKSFTYLKQRSNCRLYGIWSGEIRIVHASVRGYYQKTVNETCPINVFYGDKFDNDPDVLTDLNGKGCDLKFLYVLHFLDALCLFLACGLEGESPDYRSEFFKVTNATIDGDYFQISEAYDSSVQSALFMEPSSRVKQKWWDTGLKIHKKNRHKHLYKTVKELNRSNP
ncbi:Hypothetical predicted protein [Octopus vulgaris]|uniref:Apple domain-containing protein n=1 Tax=Octopus vulgaris TaxID=6645 RepID=A0AA36BIM5_OCTVU|nr:Hypothetical predicted protein [Octopus vulgaris]